MNTLTTAIISLLGAACLFPFVWVRLENWAWMQPQSLLKRGILLPINSELTTVMKKLDRAVLFQTGAVASCYHTVAMMESHLREAEQAIRHGIRGVDMQSLQQNLSNARLAASAEEGLLTALRGDLQVIEQALTIGLSPRQVLRQGYMALNKQRFQPAV